MNLFTHFKTELNKLEASGNLRVLRPNSQEGALITVDGAAYHNLSSNDYLGLAADEQLKTEFYTLVERENFLFSASSSRLLTGNYWQYERLESLLANMYNREAALVFSSGYHANMGILPAICDKQTLILADKLVHASLIDGIRLCEATTIRFRHNDYDQLEALVAKHHTAFREIIIVTESIFSMDGDTADLPRLVELKKKYESVWLYVDDAHGIGAVGARGLGYVEVTQSYPHIDFLVGTFGKALASTGAYLICDRVVREWLVNKMRTLIFTTGLPPVNLAWTHFILERLPMMNDRRERLKQISSELRAAIIHKGYTCPSLTHIVPMIVGESADTMIVAKELQKKGIYALPVRPPTVPQGSSRIRFSLRADLTDEAMLLTCDALPDKIV